MGTYVVTGTSSGIGREIALQLALSGHRVVALGRDGERLRQLADANPRIEPHLLDLCDRAAVAAFAIKLRASRPVDGLINNAAIQHNIRFDDPACDPSAIAAEVETNLLAPIVLSRLLLSPDGRFVVVNVSSGLALYPKSKSAVYCATKAGLRMFSDALRLQSQGTGIRVADIVLPLVDTPMTVGRGAGKISAADAARAVVKALHSGRFRTHVGKAKLLRLLHAIAPPLAAAVVRRL
ncbi:MAG: SDR family NAD(P)-dependent oxidoreductase [Proteobacteria bacterium]|nr:SDR family NAD(P)-dependent oxidoreductase [Pseudomonadota bacterium]